MILKIRLEKWQRSIVMQVLEQKKKLRGKNIIFKNKIMIIRSVNMPSLNDFENTLFIRGFDDAYDLEVITKRFKNNNLCDDFYNKIIQLLKDYAESINKTFNKDKNIIIIE